jgi:1-acyl-sn-glycerol-3-phosphate acyltransferase
LPRNPERTGRQAGVLFIRSLLFNLAFYLATILCLILPLPVYFILPQGFAMWVVRTWARLGLWLLGVLAGTRYEVRGRENIPAGGILVASKHQSMWETFALAPELGNPTYVMKSQIKWIPIFGLYTMKAGMIHVDRTAGGAALRQLAVRARHEVKSGRQIVIFPEGTRRPPGAPPAYRGGVAHLYRALGVAVLPVAVNSGLYWPRRKFLRYPGTIILEFLPALPPGLDSRFFLAKLEECIETASDRLLVEASKSRSRPPFPAEAMARLAALGHG